MPGVPDEEMMAQALPIGHGVHYIISSVQFSATVYGSAAEDCAYAYPAGMCLDTVREQPVNDPRVLRLIVLDANL